MDRFFILTNDSKDPDHSFTKEVMEYLEGAGCRCEEVHTWQEQICDQAGPDLAGACLPQATTCSPLVGSLEQIM